MPHNRGPFIKRVVLRFCSVCCSYAIYGEYLQSEHAEEAFALLIIKLNQK